MNIELISVHIPKTAGTSFRNTLISVYGEDAVLRVDIPLKQELDPEDLPDKVPQKLPKKVKVLHGHFNYLDLMALYPGLSPDIPLITWVRDPIKRVISNYNYLRNLIGESVVKNGMNIGVTNRMVKTPLEYSQVDSTRNRLARFLEGIDPRSFLFIGIQEHFSEDLAELAYLLDWKEYEEFHYNPSKRAKKRIREDVKNRIGELNKLDEDIYKQALKLRQERLFKFREEGVYPIEGRRVPSNKNLSVDTIKKTVKDYIKESIRKNSRSKLEVIAIHIEKTGGQSFKKLLHRNYKKDNYWRLNLPPEMAEEEKNELIANIPISTRVLQGHFSYQDIEDLALATKAKIIVWLRDPGERVISNYFFSKRKAFEGKRNDYPYMQTISLIEYAKMEKYRNKTAHAIKGISLDSIYFVGLMECYQEDLIMLGEMLGWRSVKAFRQNNNSEYRKNFPEPSESEKEEIYQLNSKDVELYKQAVKLREQRLQTDIS